MNIVNINAEIAEVANANMFRVNHISFNKDWFYKFWTAANEGSRNCIYEIEDLSFSYFISNLMDFLSGTSVFENHDLWFPVNKEFDLRTIF